jgi:hypothetical protein
MLLPIVKGMKFHSISKDYQSYQQLSNLMIFGGAASYRGLRVLAFLP